MRTLLLTLLLLAPALHAETVYYFVTTDHTGAQVQLDADHTSFWSFRPDVSFLLGGGKFVLKEGPSTSGDSMFSVWQGAYNPTPPPDPRTSLTYNHATWEAEHPGTAKEEQSFALTPYLLSSAATWVAPGVTLESGAYRLLAGVTYTIALSSNAGTAGSQQYFIKDPDTVGFYDVNMTPLPGPPPTITYDGPVPIPEPSTWLLLAGGVGLLAVSRTCRRRR